jgi:glucose-1-phosphate cytidylyltransferase
MKTKVIILCGGLGTRLSEETHLRPKPMVEIGDKPILWHIMCLFSKYNFTDFTLALGYKGEFIKNYFLNYHALNSDITVNTKTGELTFHKQQIEDWKISLIDTGKHTMTGGRLLRLKNIFNKPDSPFILTYGDGLADVNIDELVAFHNSHGKIATVTVVRPPSRFGGLHISGNKVIHFQEKPKTGENWINGGFFVFNKEVFNYLENDETILEKRPLENLVKDGELMAYEHNGFWQCMDTIRDRDFLQNLIKSGSAPWL